MASLADLYHCETLSPPAFKAAAELLAGSFTDDPIYQYLFPSPRLRRYVLRRTFLWFSGTVGVASRIMQVALDGEPVGVALWFPTPHIPSPPWYHAIGVWSALLPAYLLQPGAFSRAWWFDRFVKRMLAAHSRPSVHLSVLAVRPDLRRRGIGSALVHDGLRWAADQQKGAYLLCWPSLVPFYQRLGFTDEYTGTLDGLSVVCHGMCCERGDVSCGPAGTDCDSPTLKIR